LITLQVVAETGEVPQLANRINKNALLST
jgi:hypothetical protein